MRVYKAAVDADIGLRIATGAEGGEEGDDGASDGGTERESGRGRDLVLVGHRYGGAGRAKRAVEVEGVCAGLSEWIVTGL